MDWLCKRRAAPAVIREGTEMKVTVSPVIRKTANLLFLLEKAKKAGKSRGKRQNRGIVKLGPFSKSIETRFLCEMLFRA